jgi:hypothetical protein
MKSKESFASERANDKELTKSIHSGDTGCDDRHKVENIRPESAVNKQGPVGNQALSIANLLQMSKPELLQLMVDFNANFSVDFPLNSTLKNGACFFESDNKGSELIWLSRGGSISNIVVSMAI